MLALLTAGTAHAADYREEGPEPYSATNLPPSVSGATGGRLFVPDGDGPYPLLVASHGWSATADNQVGWARHFASWGFVVVVPTFPNTISPNHQVNKKIIKDLVAYYSDPTSDSPAKGKVDSSHVGLEGHSAGGLATALATAELDPGAVVLLDPVDSGGLGKNAMPEICAPMLSIFCQAGSCNSNGNWVPFKETSTGPKVIFNVVGATHCDGERPARPACGPFCGGGASATRQKEFAHYAIALFLHYLKDDAEAGDELLEEALTPNDQLTKIIVEGGPACAGDDPPDAGGDSDGDADSGPDGDADSDQDEDAGSDPDSGADVDVDAGSDGDADADADADTDPDPDTDTPEDAGGDGGSDSSCSCRAGSGWSLGRFLKGLLELI